MKSKHVQILLISFLIVVFSLVANAAEVDSGTCGDNLTWVPDNEGTLTISGTGDMYDWLSSTDIPWYSFRDSIKAIIIEDGVSSIGEFAF